MGGSIAGSTPAQVKERETGDKIKRKIEVFPKFFVLLSASSYH